MPTHKPHALRPPEPPASDPAGRAKADTAAPSELFAALDTCHHEIERQLVRLRALTITLTHAGLTATVRAEAHAALSWYEQTTQPHHLQEERLVLPALLSSDDPALAEQAQRLLQEHGWLETEWQQLEPALRATANGEASVDPQVLRHGVENFVRLYRDHMAFEETHTYPTALQQLSEA